MEAEIGYVIAVVGATGCIGKELIPLIEEHLAVKSLHLFASVASTGERVDLQGGSTMVDVFPETGFSSELMSQLHAVFFCCPSDIVEKWAPVLSEDGIAVVDMTGAMGQSVGYVLPGIEDGSEGFQAHRTLVIPSPTAICLARVWECMHRFQPIQLSAVSSVSASRFGQKGILELAAQVRALLNFQDAPQVVFPDGLAFDVLPAIGSEVDSPAEGRVQREIAELMIVDPNRINVRLEVLPVFSGVSIHGQLSLSAPALLEEIVESIEQHAFLSYRSPMGTLRGATGFSEISIGRLQLNPWVQGFEFQVMTDNVALMVETAVHALKNMQELDLL